MQENEIKELLEKVKTGDQSVDDALKALKDIPYHEMGFANVDHHRALRTGFPEAIFGQGKSAAQISAIMTELLRKGGTIMATLYVKTSPKLYIIKMQRSWRQAADFRGKRMRRLQSCAGRKP